MDGRKTTETFEVRTPVWRLHWESSGYVSITCYRDDRTNVADASAEGSDSSVVYDGPGRYYLELFSIESAEVWVEEIGVPGRKPSAAGEPAATESGFTKPP